MSNSVHRVVVEGTGIVRDTLWRMEQAWSDDRWHALLSHLEGLTWEEALASGRRTALHLGHPDPSGAMQDHVLGVRLWPGEDELAGGRKTGSEGRGPAGVEGLAEGGA